MTTRRFFAHVCTALLVFATFFGPLTLCGCGEDSPVAESDGNGGNGIQPPVLPPDSSDVTIRLVAWDDLTDHGEQDAAPADVVEIRFEISAADMQTQTRVVPSSQIIIEEDFRIKTGAARKFAVEAFGAADTLLYNGTKYTTLADSAVVTAVGMVLAADNVRPTFSGVDGAVAIGDNNVLITWTAATDGAATDPEAVYLIYTSTVSGNFDYAYPSYTTVPGATSYLVTDLAPGTTYYFVVRAMDRAGNIDLNTSEISFTTPAAGDALYVDVNAGSDNAACGSSGSPCKTITYALSKTAGNQTIRVAKGTYNAASGETFPLQLKAGTSLIGEGYWWKGVKVIKETFIEGTTPTILGANNANVVSCYVKPTAWGTSAAAIDDDGHKMTVFHCTVDGILDGRLQGVYFDGGSSLIDSRVENFAGPGGRSIAVWGAGGAVIRGNTVVNCSHGIALNASDSEVSGCVVENIEADGISAGKVDSVTTGVSIFRNHVADVGIDGVAIVNCDQVKITYNSVSGAAGYGISIWNRDEPTHLVDVFSNSVTGGNGSAVYILDGQARVNDNAFVCNVAGAFVRSDQVIDLRWNEWDHSPPTVNSGRSAVDPGCDGFYDICYEALYAGTPEPLYAPDGGKGSCVIGVVPSPRR